MWDLQAWYRIPVAHSVHNFELDSGRLPEPAADSADGLAGGEVSRSECSPTAAASLTTRRARRCEGERLRHPDKALSAAFVCSAPPGRHADGNGLYLFVQPTGTRSWVQRLVIRGWRPRARTRCRHARPARQRPRAGPRQPRACPVGAAIPSPTSAVSRAFPPSPKPPGVSSNRSAALAGPVARAQLVAEHGAVCLPPRRRPARLRGQHGRRGADPFAIWHVKAATAREVRQRIRAVLEWAIVLDMRNDNLLGPQNDI